ncbi:cation diffusion facilitator family transporter [Allocatelliglobosispora scoriae]|uniref:Cation diffusion facilitator family transporter n=1 Tax=Allocatelliglobosispora scoriae TaxID=643052 RepID=A0A841C3Z6_9ACTN|nr:cation diffusion facilitator family transporter [Allocatelliglobosispora scoriae]MBB5873863.1 cation diffusion facilitator family transporter [Allocatelliglobosispora scoriae]
MSSEESLRTVIIAGAANLGIAVAKTVAGLISGSASMLSEAAHSFADTITEVLLYVALRRGAQPADERHQFGYGKAAYFWAFIASVCTFVAGAGFSITHGVQTLIDGEELSDTGISFAVLAISFAIEAISFRQATRQVRGAAARWRIKPLRYLRITSDTTVVAVTLEDGAALIGLVLAALGLGASVLTGSAVWDGLASIAIGLLLFAVAGVLARANIAHLIGLAAPAGLQDQIQAELAGVPGIEGVPTLLTMLLGPGSLLVAAKVDFVDTISGAEVEAAADEAERRLRERFPGIRYVFLDPTG